MGRAPVAVPRPRPAEAGRLAAAVGWGAAQPKTAAQKVKQEPPTELAKSWSDRFPRGQFLEASWPTTIKHYLERGQDHSWQAIQEIADNYGCLVKLGGRRTRQRRQRPPGRLVVKGFNVEECFYAVLQESREAFKERSDIKFNSRTVPLHQQPAASSQDSQRAQRRQQWRWLV